MASAMAAIYDTAIDPAAWTGALATLGGLFGCHFADSFRRTADYAHWHGIQVGLDERDYQEEFLGRWVGANVWGTRRPTRRAGDVVTTREITAPELLRASDMYRLYLDPRELHEGLRLDIWADQAGIEDVSLLRSWSAGPFSADEMRAAHALMPHLRRAAAVRRRLHLSDSTQAAGLAAIETVPAAVLLLDQRGLLLHANRAGCALLAEADGLAAGPEGLAASPACDRALQAVVAAAAGRGGPGRSGAIRLARPSGRPALSLVAVPVRPEAPAGLDALGPRPAVLACIARPDAPPVPAAMLERLFGMTRSEAALAADLLAGRELGDIARGRGRSVNTLRTQLRAVMVKTETRRQSDLLRVLAALPRPE